jgi:hypothetical protein
MRLVFIVCMCDLGENWSLFLVINKCIEYMYCDWSGRINLKDVLVVLISHCVYCCVLTCYYTYICQQSVSTNITLCKAAVYCHHSQWMLYQQSCTCTQSHSYCKGTANCTVGYDSEALLFLGQNAVNFVKKTTFSVSGATSNTN